MDKILASSVATLDSDVYVGGGTDVTDKLQAVLDKAAHGEGVHLIMDGAALVHGLKVYSNTTIECLNSSCGFFMADNSNRPIVSNVDWSFKKIKSKNISFIGGTYNHNCTKQVHHLSVEEFPYPEYDSSIPKETNHGIFLMEFYGVENFIIRDVSFRNQRTYTLSLGNFKNAIIENSSIAMAEHVHPSNQDGFHFFGPGQFLTVKNVRGCTGDDFMNIAPDEMDGESSITDVLIDGVFFDDVCQGIRILSRKNGLLDRVTIKNVTGTYRTFGFSIIPFYHGETFGNIGDLYFENISLKQIKENIPYTPLTFLQAGGNIRSLTMKNVRFHSPVRNSIVFDIGRPFFYRPEGLTQEDFEKYHLGDKLGKYCPDWMPETARPKIGTFIVDGLTIINDEKADDTEIMELRYEIQNVVIKNAQVFRGENAKTSGHLIAMKNEANVNNFILEDVFAEKVENILYASQENSINLLKADNITLRDGKAIFNIINANIENSRISDLNEI